MAKLKPAQFFREVDQERRKVTWPTRKETGITTIMVFVMVIIMMIFFTIIDSILLFLVEFVLQFGS